MIEARSFVESIEEAGQTLASMNAEYKGEYKIHDKIFSSKTKPLTEEFLRLRLVPLNIWNEKPVVLAIKNTEVKNFGKNSIIPLKKQFDTEAEAQKYIEENLLNDFEFSFEFSRMGWQYNLGNDQVDLEDVEGHLSIEVKSETEEGVARLIEIFSMKNILKGPSVVSIKELLMK